MARIAKAFVYDNEGNLLVLRRSGTHPHYAYEPDLPGGIVEAGESYKQGLIRELYEEAGITVHEKDIHLASQSRHYVYGAKHLYQIWFKKRPGVTISWEHDQYAWVSPTDAPKALASNDPYMHFAVETLIAKKKE